MTLACERCYVTNGYLQRLVWDVNGFFLKERKNGMLLNKIDFSYCLVVFFVVCLSSQAVLKRFRRVSAILVFHC